MNGSGEYMDVHKKLLAYATVRAFLERLEQKGDLKSYCNGSNVAGIGSICFNRKTGTIFPSLDYK